MTSEPRPIDAICQKCGDLFKGWYRPSINLNLGEEWTEEDIRQANTLTCPKCGFEMHMGCLVVGKDGVFRFKDE